MSIILNKEELLKSNSELRKQALEILEAGYEAIDTEKILRNKVSLDNGILNIDSLNFDLKSYDRIFFIGIGKCALDGAKVIEDILGDYLTAGAVIDVREAADAEALASRGKIKYFQGTHPLPSQQNVEATKEILKMVKGVTEKDLIIALISGGGSSLFELPVPNISLDTIVERTKELTTRGTDIYELNAARKEISQVKGGKFAQICHPAPMVSLIFSDVPGNDISVIASGPTVIDPLPNPSPDQGERRRGGVVNVLIASNKDALNAMKAKAEELGFDTTIETEKLSGNASEVGKELAGRGQKSKTCILFGGETTVKISESHGKGGRNQEMALSALPHMPPDSVLVCAASDGFDNTDHAGAIADKELFEKAKNMNLSPEEYLERSDSYNFFKKINGGICTGKLGSNVADLFIMLYK